MRKSKLTRTKKGSTPKSKRKKKSRKHSLAAKKGWKTRKRRLREARRKHKKFKRKNTSHRPRLQMKFALKGPKGSTRHDRLMAIRTAIKTGELPKGWKPARDNWVSWRNPDTKKGRSKNWQSDSLTGVLPSLGRVLRKVFK